MSNKSNLWIRVDVVPGSSIGTTCEQLTELANKLGHTVTTQFNGVELMAIPGGNPETLATNWEAEMKGSRQIKIVSSHERE